MTERDLQEAQRVERAIGRVRWAAAVIALFLGPLFPNLSAPGVYALGLGIVAYNVATLVASARSRTHQTHARVARAAFAADVVALCCAMLLFSADPQWTTYILGMLVITAGGFRFGTRGATAATVALAVAYAAIVVFRSQRFGIPLEPERILFTLSAFVMSAILVDRVMRDARQLRGEREGLIARLERRVAEDAALAVASRVVATVDAPAEVIPRVLEATRSVLQFDRATVFAADEAAGEYRVLHRLASDGDVLPPRQPLGRGLIAAALEADRALLLPDVVADPRYEARLGETPRSVILVPLRVAGRPIAVFSLSRALRRPFTEEDVRISEAVAALIAQTLENQRLFAEASEAQALRELDKLKDEFLAAVSHELRTPLTVVIGALELLERGRERLPETAAKLVGQASRHAQRLANSVGELLDIAQLQEAKVELDPEFIACEEVLNDVAAAHEALAAGRGQRIAVRCEGVPPAYVDRRRMQQALGNLVANAVRYSPDGTTIEFAARLDGREIVFSVTDQGPGIPPEEREHVFDKFVRLRRDRDVPGGTGLGLAIAKDLVTLHGGRIWVEGARPGGACFCVAIPYEAMPLEGRRVG